MKKLRKCLAAALMTVMLLPTTVFAQEVEKYDNPNPYSKEKALEYSMDSYAATDVANAAAYFYDYTGIQIYWICEEAWEYDDDYDMKAKYSSTKEYQDAMLSLAKDILTDDQTGIVVIEAQGHKRVDSFHYVMFGSEMEKHFPIDAKSIMTEILTEPTCVIENYSESDRTQAVKLIIPKVMEGMTYDEFKDTYYYYWIDGSYYDDMSWWEIALDMIIYTTLEYAFIVIPAIIFIVIAIVIFRVRHGYKRKSDAEAKLIEAQVEREKAEAEYLRAKADAEILEADLYSDSDPVLEKYKDKE